MFSRIFCEKWCPVPVSLRLLQDREAMLTFIFSLAGETKSKSPPCRKERGKDGAPRHDSKPDMPGGQLAANFLA